MESIRQSVHDQVLNLRTEISQHLQAISDNRTSLQTEQSIRLAEQIEKSQASVEKEQDLRRESELKMTQLQDQLDKAKSELSLTQQTAQQHERYLLEHERRFSRYRADALAELDRLNKSVQQTTAETQTKDRELEAIRQKSVDLTIKLESTEKERSRLFDDNLQVKSSNESLREEITNKTKDANRRQELLCLAIQSKTQLEAEQKRRSAKLETLRDKWSQSKSREMQLEEDKRNLERQINEQRTVYEDEAEARKKAMIANDTLIEDLRAKLTVSGNAERECEKRLRQAETTHKLQMDHHKQETKAQFDILAATSEQVREKLRAGFEQECDKIRAESKQECDKSRAKSERECDKVRAESEKECDRIRAECQKTITAYRKDCGSRIAQSKREHEKLQTSAIPSRSEILVPNTQQSADVDRVISSPQNLRTAKTRKRVDRHSSSTDPKSATDGSGSGHGTRESVTQDGFFDEEYESRFGTQVSPCGRETQISLIGDEDEIAPETQDFDCAQGRAGDVPETQEHDPAPGIADVVPDTQAFQCAQGNVTRFEVIKSQASVGDVDEEDSVSDLSSLPSDELAEMDRDMLFDTRHTSGQESTHSRDLLSQTEPDKTPRRANHSSTSEDPASQSQARPKSRANTASRIMPLPNPEVPARRSQPDVGPSCLTRTYLERVSGGDDEHTTSVPTNDVTPKHPYGHHSSTRASTTTASQKRRSTTSIEESAPFNKLRKSAQSYAQRPPSKSKSFTPYTPTPAQPAAHNDATFSPSSSAARSIGSQYPSLASSQRGLGRLSSTRNTRSKSEFVN
jgi:hypothetical protein